MIVICTAAAGLLVAAEPAGLFRPGEEEVTFKLKDTQGKTPHLMLFTAPNQAGTADSINFWRGTEDPKQTGVVVDFKALRFIRSPKNPDHLIVRLVGIKNELQLGNTISLEELESGQPQKLHFGPVAMGFGPLSGTTDAELRLKYNPARRTLTIPEVSGQFEWKRPFNDPQKDSGALKHVTGEIGEVPSGDAVLKAPPSNEQPE